MRVCIPGFTNKLFCSHSSREQALHRFFQTLKINWLSEMLGEACLSGLVYILFATETAQRDSRQILLEAHFAHQFITAAFRLAICRFILLLAVAANRSDHRGELH